MKQPATAIILCTSDAPEIDPAVAARVLADAHRERPALWSRAWRLMAAEQDARLAREAALLAEQDAAAA